MLFNFLQPSPQIVKSLISSDIIGQEDAVCSPVEYPGHRLERFLSRRVPNLQFDYFIVNPDAIGSELYSYGDLMLLLEFIVHYSLHETTLADSSVTNDDQFEEVVLTGNGSILLRQNLKWDRLDLINTILLHYPAWVLLFAIKLCEELF